MLECTNTGANPTTAQRNQRKNKKARGTTADGPFLWPVMRTMGRSPLDDAIALPFSTAPLFLSAELAWSRVLGCCSRHFAGQSLRRCGTIFSTWPIRSGRQQSGSRGPPIPNWSPGIPLSIDPRSPVDSAHRTAGQGSYRDFWSWR